MYKKSFVTRFADFLWDVFCVVSVIGVWPRFVEPRLLSSKQVKLPLPKKHGVLDGVKIFHFSDLHFRKKLSSRVLNKLLAKVRAFAPDIVVFTGDFLCHANLEDQQRLKRFLTSFSAPYGCYYVYGNHDYQEYVTRDLKGTCNVIKGTTQPLLLKVFKELIARRKIGKRAASKVDDLSYNEKLHSMLQDTPFRCVENETLMVNVGDTCINITGLGDYWLQRCHPQKAFDKYDDKYYGVVLVHNPDSLEQLRHYPGDLVLCGHTHGGQVNIPFMQKKFVPIDDKRFIRGLSSFSGKNVYVSKGVGSHIPFRFCACPEVTMITLEHKS